MTAMRIKATKSRAFIAGIIACLGMSPYGPFRTIQQEINSRWYKTKAS